MFKIQVQVMGVWRDVHPSGLPDPYTWRTREEAERMASVCYPDNVRLGHVRVVAHDPPPGEAATPR